MLETILRKGACLFVLSLLVVQQCQVTERISTTYLVSCFAETCQALLEQRTGSRVLPLIERHQRQVMERPGYADRVSEFPVQRHALCASPLCLLVVSLLEEQQPKNIEHVRPHRCHPSLASRERFLHPLTPLTQVVMCQPEPPDGVAQPQGQFYFFSLYRPMQGRPQIRMFPLQTIAPSLLLGTDQVRPSLLCKLQVIYSMSVQSDFPLPLCSVGPHPLLPDLLQ